MRDQDLKLGMAALEHARTGGQANITPEMASALIERMEYLRELCGLAAARLAYDTGAHDLAQDLEAAAKGDA